MRRVAAVLLFAFLSCSTTEPPEDVLRALYEHHQPQYDREVDLDNRPELERYFSPELTDLFIRDSECEERTKEVCNLGFDPIFAAQDFDEKPLDLQIERLSATRYKVTFTNINRRSLIYEVVDSGGKWRISDILYPEGESLKKILSN